MWANIHTDNHTTAYQQLPISNILLFLLLVCLIEQIYIQWQVLHQGSQRDGRVCQIHLPPSPPLSVHLICPGAEADIFSFLLVWPPILAQSGTLGWGAMLFTAQRALCAESTHHGWLSKGTTCCSLSHTQPRMYTQTHTQSHMTIPGGWQRCLPCYNHYALQNWQTQKQTDTDVCSPDSHNLPEFSNCGNVTPSAWWCGRVNTHKSEGKVPPDMTGFAQVNLTVSWAHWDISWGLVLRIGCLI